jgi:hypothetical protein
VLQWFKGTGNEPNFDRPRPKCGQPYAFSQLVKSPGRETFPAGFKWVLQRLAELASTGRAIDCVMKEVSKAAMAAALRVTNKGTIKTRKNSPSPKKRSRIISLSHLTIAYHPACRSPSRSASRSLLRRASRSLSHSASHSPLRRASRSLSRGTYLSPPLPQPLSRHARKQRAAVPLAGSPLRGSFCSPSRDASRSPLRRASCSPLLRASRSPSCGASRSLLRARRL